MKTNSIPLDELNPNELGHIWLLEYVPSKDGRLWVKPIKTNETKKFSGRIAGCEVTLADGTQNSAFIEGIDIETPKFSKHHRTLILWIPASGWFQLAKYYSNDELKAICGDEVLCNVLGKSLDEVFPISFDLRDRSSIDSPCLTGTFEHNPSWGLSGAEVMQILVDELS